MRKNRVNPLNILRGQRGEGKSGCIVTILLFVIGGYIAYSFVVPLYHHNAFEQRVAEMMPYYRNQEANFIQRAVLEISNKEFGLNLKPEQVKVQVLKRDNRLVIDVTYKRVVEVPFYTHTLTFKPHLTGSVY